MTTTKQNKTKLELRISSGTAKNKRLKTPTIENFRAVQEVAKGAIFAILGQESLENAQVLDLFAGSGNLGLEALSRGAEFCDFVDEHPESIQAINDNLFNCGFLEKATTHRKEAAKFAANTENKYDIIFLDPFYKDVNHIFLFKQLQEILKHKGKVVYLYGPEADLEKLIKDTDLTVVTTRRFGGSFFSVLEKN